MAYAALLSLTSTLEQNLQFHVIPNKQQVETLLQGASFLRDFLENSLQKSSGKIEHLESQIRDVAYKAENIIESHFVDGLLSESESHGDESFTTFTQNLEKVIYEINSIKQQVVNIDEDEHDLQPGILLSSSSSESVFSGKSVMVGLDDNFMEIKTRLARQSTNLEILSIVGMGGIGKTTLARKVYDDFIIMDHFYIYAWVTVTQEYNEKKFLLELLGSMKKLTNEMGRESNDKLGEILYKNLKGRRFLIVLDDMWDARVWNEVNRYFPNDNNGSRIMLTTRIENVAVYANSCPPLHQVRFLNNDESWNLFCDKVFGHKGCCPLELEDIGKTIVQNCRGLPLTVVVIGGLLSKAKKTEHYWRNVAKNLGSITSNDDQFLKILSLSYNHLPHHLKGCFLYMGIFPEDFNIHVAMLVNLWIAEGILQPKESQSCEDVAYQYLLDLVDRSLVSASERSSDGKIRICKIHDLLRDLCVKEAQKQNFFHVTDETLQGIPSDRVHRVSIHRNREILYYRGLNLPTSLIQSSLFVGGCLNLRVIENLRLLRVLHAGIEYRVNLPDGIIQLVNLRYLSGRCNQRWPLKSIYKLQNLQTLILYIDASVQLPPEIWKMTQLRHVQFVGNVNLSDPPSGELGGVLENLHTLSSIRNFRCTEEVLRRIPNLKKLEISYRGERMDWEYYCLDNLGKLHKLETLKCFFYGCYLEYKIVKFPPSLKKLTLLGCKLPWEDMKDVALLPNLEVLKLKRDAFIGEEWEPTEGEFVELKFLLLENIDLEYWTADGTYFPKLERLVIKECHDLEKIPSDIGEIPTLQSIKVHDCSDPVETSAKEIREEQLELGNEALQVQILRDGEYL